MAWRSSGATNADLVGNLFKNGLITSPIVRDAMLKVDRANYCPERRAAYEDSPQSIGWRATISAPHMHANAAETLLPYILERGRSTTRILDIGSGSGYLTHVLAELGGEHSRVVGIEHISELRDLGERNVASSEQGRRLLADARLRFVVGDGRKGWVNDAADADGAEAEEPGWDAIHVGAAAATVHDELVAQLRRPGRLFIPVSDSSTSPSSPQHIWLVDKDADGNVETKKLYGVLYVPLTDAPGQE